MVRSSNCRSFAKGLSARALPTLSKLVAELAYEHRYAELVKLLESHLVLLDNAAARRLRLARLHDRLLDLDPSALPPFKRLKLVEEGKDVFGERSVAHRYLALLVSRVGHLVPNQGAAEEAAKEIFRVLLQSPDLTNFVAMQRPEFGVRLLSCSLYGVQDFCDDYLRALIGNSQSTLYAEIKQNQNVSATTGYAFPEYNRLLHFLFNDARTAEKLAPWKPLGEHLIALLRPGNDPGYAKFLNGAADSFEDEKWRDKAFVTIRFFDLMVNAAEHQGIQWHMWLYYFPYFIEGLISIYDASDKNIDQNAEWPTRASYLIYQIFSAITGWIETVTVLPESSPHLAPENQNLTHENGNIPKSASLALGSCLETLLTADCVSERFKNYIHEMVMSTIRHMSKKGPVGQQRAILIQAIIQGGPHLDHAAEGYGDALREMWDATDHTIRADIHDYRNKLWKAYP